MKQSIVRRLASEAAKVKSDKPFSIPYAIKRSPTDLLKALNSTVGVDKTAPHFSFIDDPTTIPTTARQKKTYFLAKELGKRAARQLAEEWPTLFMFDRDYPRLPAFRPEKALDPVEVEPTVENLNLFIKEKQVSSAVRLFERMQSGNIEVPTDTQTQLFRLVAYYNAEDVPLTEIEEWHGLRNFFSSGDSKWPEAGIGDLLFEGLEKTPENYSTMIAALCKYPTDVSVLRAKSLFQEMISKNLVPNEEAFNGLILISSPSRVKAYYLKLMNDMGVAPSVRTFNSYLMITSKINEFPQQWKYIREILGEMKATGVKPSLTTFSIVLEVLYPLEKKEDGEVIEKVSTEQLQMGVNILNEILIKLEMGGSLDNVDSTDQNFFLNAIRIAVNANNEELADRIEKLYSDRKNTVAMTALTTESVFYSRYLTFKAKILPIDALEKLYKELVPRVVGTTRSLTLLLTERLSREHNWSFTKRVVGDSIASRNIVDGRLASSIRKLLLAQDTFKMTSEEKEEYQSEITRIVDAVLEFANFTQPYLKRLQTKLTASTACECALLLCKADQYNRAWELIELLLDDDKKRGDEAIVSDQGYVPHDILLELLDVAISRKDWYNASHCIELIAYYQKDANLERLVAKIDVKCSLTPIQRRILLNFVRLRQ